MGIFDNVRLPSSEGQGGAPSAGGFPPPTPNTPSSLFGNVRMPGSEPATEAVRSPYFSAVDATGNSFGFSDTEYDPSGRPLFAYRKPGDKATTTDRRRTATKFDPRQAQPLKRDDYYNPRAVQNRDQIKSALGAAYNEDLDHAIALTLSGSNDPENLRLLKDTKNAQFGALEQRLAMDVAAGRKSLFDAQIEAAKAKGIDIPFTGEDKESTLESVLNKIRAFLTPDSSDASQSPLVQNVSKPEELPQNQSFLTSNVRSPQQIMTPAPKAPAPQEQKKGLDVLGKVKNFIVSGELPGGINPINPLANLDKTAEPILKYTFNTPLGKRVSGTVADATSDLPLKLFARIEAAKPEKTYKEAFDAYKAAAYKEDAPVWQKFLTQLQDTGGQTALGVALSFIPYAGKPLSTAYWSMISADEQIKEKGKVTSAQNILIDTVGDQILGNSLSGLLKSPINSLKNTILKAGLAEGGTEVAQTFLKLATNYQNAETPEERTQVLERAKDYVVSGEILMEFAVGATAGAGIGTAGYTINTATNELIAGQQEEPEDKGPVERFKKASGVQEGYQDTGELSTTVLSKLEGRETVSKQFISDLTNSPDLKQQERELIRDVLASYPDGNVPVKEFADKVKAELLPLKINKKDNILGDDVDVEGLSDREYNDMMRDGGYTKHENVVLNDDLRGEVQNYSEHVYESPIKTSAGDTHFRGQNIENYFGHTRIEDMADGSTRRVIEVQSDLYQKGNLEREAPLEQQNYRDMIVELEGAIKRSNSEIMKADYRATIKKYENKIKTLEADTKKRNAEINKLKQYSNPTAHFRMVREEVKRAAQDGKSTLLFPTGETAMKIEGLGDNTVWSLDNSSNARPEELAVGKEIYRGTGDIGTDENDAWIITDVLGDGKFKAVTKNTYDAAQRSIKAAGSDVERAEKARRSIDVYSETFDISGKVDTNNPIYRFYEKDLGRYLKSKYNAVPFTDSKGVTWYKLSVSPEAAQKPVTAFKKKPIFSKLEGPRITIAEARALILENINKRDVGIIFTDELINGSALGEYSDFGEGSYKGMDPRLRPIIKLYVEGEMTSATTTLHESYHYIHHNFLTPAQQKKALDYAWQQMGILKKVKYRALDGYKGRSVIAEEFIADEYAKYKAKEKGYITEGPITKVFAMIDAVLKRILATYNTVIARAKKVASENNLQSGKIDFFAEGGGEIKPNADEIKKALTEQDKIERKAAAQEAAKQKPKTPFDEEVESLSLQVAALEDAVKNNPARALAKYANANGEIPEVLGAKAGTFARSGDDIVTELGFTDSEQARLAYQNYRLQQRRLEATKADLSNAKEKQKNARKEDEDAKSLKSLLDREGKRTAREVADEERRIKARIEDLRTQRKLQEEAQYKDRKKALIEKSKLAPIKTDGFFMRLKRALKPINYEDNKVQEIYKKWVSDRFMANELAEQDLREFGKPGAKDEMQVIFDYQDGQPSKYNQQVRETFDTLYTEAIRRGIPVHYRDQYVPQVWVERDEQLFKASENYLKDLGLSEEMIKDYMTGKIELPTEVVNRLKLNPMFEKTRVFPDYRTGMQYGLTPKYRNVPALVAFYRKELEYAVANRDFIDALAENGKIIITDMAPKGWKVIDTPFSPKLYTAPPSLAKLLNGIFRDENNISVGEHLFRGTAKFSRLAQEIMLSAGVPKTNINFFSIGQSIKSLATAVGHTATFNAKDAASEMRAAYAFLRANSDSASTKFFQQNEQYLKLMAQNGIDIGRRFNTFENLYGNVSRSTVWEKTFGRAYEAFDKLFNEKTFGSFMPQMYTQIFKDTFNAQVASGVPNDEAAKFAAKVTENAFGITGEVGRGKTTEDVLGSAFFAPRFREGLINIFWNMGKSLTTEVRNPAFAKNRAFFIGMVLMFFMYDWLNEKLSGNHMWDNPPGRQFALRIPLDNGDIIYIEFMPSVLAFARNMATGAIALATGDTETAGQKFGSLLSMPLKTGAEVITNRDYFGRKIYDESDTVPQKTLKIAKYVGLSVSHPYIKELINQLGDKKPLYQSFVGALELPLKFSSMSKEQQNEFYRAIDEQSMKKERERKAFMPIYEEIQKLSPEDAQRRVDALSEAEYAIYKNLKAADKRKQTAEGQARMTDTVKKVKKLIDAGRRDEAQAIVDALSEEDYRLYQLAKNKINP